MNMGVMDKFLNAMKLGDVEDEYDSDDYYDEDEIEETPKKSFFKEKSHEEEDEEFEHRKSSSKVTPIRQVKRTPGSNMEVCIIKPTSMEDAQEITDTLVANRTVVLNLEGLDVEIGQRIVDYTSGSIYALGGKLQKISNYILDVTPASVGISGDFQEILSGTFDVPPISHSVI